MRGDLTRQIRLHLSFVSVPSTPARSSDAGLSVEPAENRDITIPEAIGLDFHSFIPQADITSQVHFVSNVQEDSVAYSAGLRNGDHLLKINGVNVANLEHEDVRKLMQLMTPMTLTVASDPKYLSLLEQPVNGLEEKKPGNLSSFLTNVVVQLTSLEPPILSSQQSSSDSINSRSGRYELSKDSSVDSKTSSSSSGSKLRSCEVFPLSRIDASTEEEPLSAKRCRLRKSKHYDGYGLVLKYQQDLHVIDRVEEASPSHRAGLRENDVIVFVGKKNVEKFSHDDVKVLIQATALGSDYVELLVLSKLDVPRYKKLQEKGLIDWATMELEK